MPVKPSIVLHEFEKSGSGIKAGKWESEVMGDEYVPHRHDHYTCMLLEDGELDVLLDGQPLSMQKWTLFISYPDQIHQVLRSKNDIVKFNGCSMACGSTPACAGY